jgi:DNA replication and repair protein RecF
MILQRLELKNFRSHLKKELEFAPGVNIIIGKNGVGKTNCIEAINYLISKKSHKTTNNKSMINSEHTSAQIRGEFQFGNIGLTVKEQISCGKTAPSSSTMLHEHHARVVTFSPESLEIISGVPEKRREILDSIISQYDNDYSEILQTFNKIVKQRNNLLKNSKKSADSDIFDVWNQRFAKYSSNISTKRQIIINHISERYQSIYNSIAQNKNNVKIELKTEPETVTNEAVLELLEKRLEKEKILGYTTSGAQKDDFMITVNGIHAKQNLSQGETWSLIFALIETEYQFFASVDKQFSRSDPILLLDDIFMGIDKQRRKKIVEIIKDKPQVIITSADEAEIPAGLQYNKIVI